MIELTGKDLLSKDELDLAIENRQYPKVEVAKILQKIKKVSFYRLPQTTCIACFIELDNRSVFSDISNCIDPRNYDELIGKTNAYNKVITKIIDAHAYHILESDTIDS